MPELLLELFSEEIPARMQSRAADDLARLVGEALAPLAPSDMRGFAGPRRIALAATVASSVPESRQSERGPRRGAPEAALAGFLRKHGADRADLHEEGDYWVLERLTASVDAATLIARVMPDLLRRFPWPKSMRWGGTSGFTWIRPLRRILCLLDGATVPFDLRQGDDDGHGLAAGNVTEGHRFLAPGPVAVTGAAQWEAALLERRVVARAGERARLIAEGIGRLAAAHGLTVVEDAGLLDEVAGLVEWPVPMLGRIDDAFMDLPAEVMQVSMRVNQRYFALREADGRAAPWFAFVANIEALDGGAAIVAGNERVLRARFADARHFWDLDRRTPLAERLPALDRVTFHARLGTQGERVLRLAATARTMAPLLGADPALAARAGLLAKADLTSGMVGEFPELQGVMGGYYAAHDGEDAQVAEAIRLHYAPRGPNESIPLAPVAVAVALADKLDQLCAFFGIGEKPTGGGDPYALRRAALGVIRIIRERGLRVSLRALIDAANAQLAERADADELLGFLIDRLRIQLRAEGARHDVLAAVFATGADDDLVRALARSDAVAGLLLSREGADLLAGYRRAANILAIETRKDGPFEGEPDIARLELAEEITLASDLAKAGDVVVAALAAEDFSRAIAALAELRPGVDAFFERVTVNAEDAGLRANRLRLLSSLRRTMNMLADFGAVEGK